VKKIKKYLNAFSLVETLVVLGLVSALIIFSAVAVPVQIQKARDAVRKDNLDRVKKAAEEYYQDTNCYPIALPVCGNDIVLGDLKLLDNIPCDPKTRLSYVYVPETTACPSWFQIYGNLEYITDKIIDRVGCRNGCGPDCQFNYGVSSTNQKLNPYCEASLPVVPTAEPESEKLPDQYVCAPGGACEIFVNPQDSGCPDIYLDDPTCQNQCSEKEKRCHDSRGKTSMLDLNEERG
jgi:type II secretory pathway pseudopilin PulG